MILCGVMSRTACPVCTSESADLALIVSLSLKQDIVSCVKYPYNFFYGQEAQAPGLLGVILV